MHFVDDGVDTGPVILQAAVPVLAGDTADALAARILRQEHRLYPQVVRWFAEGRIKLEAGKAHVAGVPQGASLLFSSEP